MQLFGIWIQRNISRHKLNLGIILGDVQILGQLAIEGIGVRDLYQVEGLEFFTLKKFQFTPKKIFKIHFFIEKIRRSLFLEFSIYCNTCIVPLSKRRNSPKFEQKCPEKLAFHD